MDKFPYRKIVDYNAVSSYDLNTLNKKVQELIANGWEPFGSINSNGGDARFVQPMVRYHVFTHLL